MQRQTTIAVWCERIIEGGWLLALIFIPSYFNLLSSRHFEPDKATTLRAIVLVMAAAGLVRALELWGSRSSHREGGAPTEGAFKRAWRRLNAVPLALPALIYALVFVFATFTSVVPGTSFWGSYQRLQGTYTNLSYIGLAAMIVVTLRRREQLDRLITVLVLSSLIAIGYGLVQHLQLDPLPWKGDVITRVASTMGNSIFVAAYLIMVLPFVLYRVIVSFDGMRQAPPDRAGAGADLGWAAAYLLAVVGALALVYSSMKFGAYVRTADLRYWWIYPGALAVALGLFMLPTLRIHSAGRKVMVWPGILLLLYVLLLFLFYTLGQGPGQREEEFPGRIARDWALWMIGGIIAVISAYVLFYVLPRRAEAPSRLLLGLEGLGMLVILVLLVLAVALTQSRGPWIGAGVSLIVFFTLLLMLAWRRDRARALPSAKLWGGLLISELVLAVVAIAFVVSFNFIKAPIFDQLRSVPYLGRLGTLLDTSPGTTGDVRMKIWFGDDKAGGAVALITLDPLRTVIGWGPESMFVAYNQVYPPSLANVEARGASPDRSHEAYLDELVTKGVLGLISYLFVLISFFALAWRLTRRTDEWPMQVLIVACVAVVLAHSVEGLFGIPIVSTLMMLWVTMAVLVVVGVLVGQYTLDAAVQPAPEPAAQPAVAASSPQAKPPVKGQAAAASRRTRQGAVARGAQGRAVAGRRARRDGSSSVVFIYAVIIALALAGVWFFNVDNVYADMRFQQGQTYTDAPNAGLNEQIVGMDFLLQAIRMEPGQDFYYLNLGRTLMNIVDIRRQTGDTPPGQPKPDARIEDLLRQQDLLAVQSFVQRQTPLELLSYAQVVLERARQLNPLNKDHYANLARMYSFWYSRFDHNPEQLRLSIDWYRQGHEIAPQDVVILNEYAGAVALMGSDAQSRGDQAAAQASYAQAEDLLKQSKQLDPRYADTDTRMAELLRLEGRAAEATDRYVALLETNPHALDQQINGIIEGLRGQPDQLKRLRDVYAAATAKKPDDAPLFSFMGLLSVRAGDLPHAAESYARLTQLQPNNVEARRNYALVLSDTQQYQQAATEAEAMLSLAQQQQLPQQQTEAIQGLLEYLRARAAGA